MMKHVAAVSLVFVATAAAEPRPADAIRDAAKAYAKWHRVDERPNIAPGLCRMPTPEDYGAPGRVRRSAAADAHGKKLYYLYASDRARYLDPKSELPIGFTIVKESFAAVPTDAAPTPEYMPSEMGVSGAIPPPVATMIDADGKRYAIGKPMGLYVMVKVGKQPGSDDGWIYGTVAPDGTVTSAGRVAGCMGCHDDAAREKLFGLRAAPKP